MNFFKNNKKGDDEMKKIILVGLVSLLSTVTMAFDVVSGCEESDYVDGDIKSSIVTQGLSYTPKCLRIVVGSEVTIAASGHHPLAPLVSDENNPIEESSESVTVTFDEVGVFGYKCVNHEAAGMVGAIMVVAE